MSPLVAAPLVFSTSCSLVSSPLHVGGPRCWRLGGDVLTCIGSGFAGKSQAHPSAADCGLAHAVPMLHADGHAIREAIHGTCCRTLSSFVREDSFLTTPPGYPLYELLRDTLPAHRSPARAGPMPTCDSSPVGYVASQAVCVRGVVLSPLSLDAHFTSSPPVRDRGSPTRQIGSSSPSLARRAARLAADLRNGHPGRYPTESWTVRASAAESEMWCRSRTTETRR